MAEKDKNPNLLATSIREMMHKNPPPSPDWFIFRVPNFFREPNEKAFNPQSVSIGPFHHGKEELQSMEKLKVAYLKAFLDRTNYITLETCINWIKESENKIRNCYAETFEFISSDEFVKMMLLDSCFVIEVILRTNHRGKQDQLSRRSVMDTFNVEQDILLVENQLPFFVLEGLFNQAFPTTNIGTWDGFVDLCLVFMDHASAFSVNWLPKEHISQQQQSDVKHLLDLFRVCLAPSIPRGSQGDYGVDISMPTLTELKEAGMVIKPHPHYRSQMDIRYTKGVLEIPKFRINKNSKRVLANVVALECCLYSRESYVSDYITFMDKLIATGKDVDLLIQNEIIGTQDSSDSQSVAAFFNHLPCICAASSYFYRRTQDDVKAYYRVPWNRWRASLERDYFSSPWIIASTTAALTLLILTLIQTVCSVISIS